jgi:branched-chain amino acid aminotransferase
MISLNGIILPDAEARIDPADRGFTLGEGLFETIAVHGGVPLRLEAHLARLADGAEQLGLPLPGGRDGVAQAIHDLLAATPLLPEAVLRLTLTGGPAPRGLLPPSTPSPTLLITTAPLPPPPSPARALIARSTCRNEYSPLSRLKTTNYLDSILARREAAAAGFDEALLLNTQGRLAEASMANLFVVIGGVAITPPISEGALPGIRRAAVIAALGAMERPLTIDDLAKAEEVFLTSSLSVRPIMEVGEWRWGEGKAAQKALLT